MPRSPIKKLASAVTTATVKRIRTQHQGQETWRDFLASTQLPAGGLRKGDILVVKLYEDYKYWSDVDAKAPYSENMGNEGNSILVAQAIFSHVRHGSATSEHVLMVADDGAEAVYEAVGTGVARNPVVWDRWHAVYRVVPARKDLADEAATVAQSLSQQRGIRSTVKYRTVAGYVASPFRSKHAGPGRSARLKRVYDIVYNGRGEKRNGLRMICSEFVATCYEVAAMRLDQPPIFNIDPRGLTAKALDAMLNRRASYFPQVGIYQGSKHIVRVCPDCHGQVRCMYVLDAAGDRCARRDPLTGKERYPYVTICPQCNVCPGCHIVWTATILPGSFIPVFYCRQCENYPQAGGAQRYGHDVVAAQGGAVDNAGDRKKPLKRDDEFFIR